MRRLRLYLDTSVIGGYFDEEFEKQTKRLFSLLKAGVYQPFISELAVFELYRSPSSLLEKIKDLLSEFEYERLVETVESRELAQAYIEANVLPLNNSIPSLIFFKSSSSVSTISESGWA